MRRFFSENRQMIRNLRDIICLLAAVLLTGLAACHANDTASCPSDFRLASILENFQQDSFNPGKSSPENFMEQNIAGAAGVPANGCVSPRCQSSIKSVCPPEFNICNRADGFLLCGGTPFQYFQAERLLCLRPGPHHYLDLMTLRAVLWPIVPFEGSISS